MAKCDKCGQDMPAPTYLDAFGREFDVRSVLLYMKPVYNIDINGVTVSSVEPIATKPVPIYLNASTVVLSKNKYTIKGTEFNMRYITVEENKITGTPGEPNPHVCKIADSMEDLPL